MLLISLTVWFGLSIALIFGLEELSNSTENITKWIGIGCFILHILLGLFITFLTPTQAPPGSNKVKVWQLILRGLLASIAIFTAIMLTLVDDIAAGIATTFPAIFCTTMVSLWISQDSSVPVGAVGPLFVGSTSVSLFVLLFYGCVVLLKSKLNKEAAIAVGIIISYVLALFGASLPAFYINKCGSSLANPVEYVEDETTTIIDKV